MKVSESIYIINIHIVFSVHSQHNIVFYNLFKMNMYDPTINMSILNTYLLSYKFNDLKKNDQIR